jgi:hypothetical protein
MRRRLLTIGETVVCLLNRTYVDANGTTQKNRRQVSLPLQMTLSQYTHHQGTFTSVPSLFITTLPMAMVAAIAATYLRSANGSRLLCDDRSVRIVSDVAVMSDARANAVVVADKTSPLTASFTAGSVQRSGLWRLLLWRPTISLKGRPRWYETDPHSPRGTATRRSRKNRSGRIWTTYRAFLRVWRRADAKCVWRACIAW